MIILIFKRIYLDKLFYLFLLIIILTGSFNNFILYFILLLIHELGHAIVGIILGYKLNKITFYPYGGITTFNYPINIPLKNELLILIMGPIFQIIGYFILKNFYTNIYLYHYTLLIFNLLPIYPLDGGKILNIICGYIFNYLKSLYITFIISIIFMIIVIIYNTYNFNLNLILMIFIMFIKLLNIYKKRYYYYNRFLLERYLYNYNFKKLKIINNDKCFFRDRKHIINFQEEKRYLKKLFKKY